MGDYFCSLTTNYKCDKANKRNSNEFNNTGSKLSQFSIIKDAQKIAVANKKTDNFTVVWYLLSWNDL